MVRFAVIAFLGLGTLVGGAQMNPRPLFPGAGIGAHMHASLTGQFVIREQDNPGGYPIPLGSDISVRYIRVDPTLLAVSCERIKHALLTEIDTPDKWQDKIFVDLRHARTLDDTVVIESGAFGRGWSYHVSLPDTVESTRLITSIVDVLLLEMANRNASRSAEIPTWLGYGLSEDIMRSSRIELVLEPGKREANGLNIGTMTVVGLITNALAVAHQDLQAAPPLTFEQLSWPETARLDGRAGATYRASAQLLVNKLLQLKAGHAALRGFIEELPQHLNWQLSFLHAFRADFASQLDLEKWWTLQVVDFTGRDFFQTWNAEESWQKLNDIVRPVVEVRTKLGELPRRTEISLQTIIQKWDMPKQTEFLKERSKQLYLLRSRVSQELAKLTDDYRRTIDVYLEKRAQDGNVYAPRVQAILGPDRSGQQAMDDLNVLDSIREDLRPKAQTAQTADARAAH